MRTSLAGRVAVLVGSCGLLPGLLACLDHPLKPVELDSESEKPVGVPVSINKDVDILFVIDNSGSMADEQRTLAKNFAAFISVLEEEGVEANYRIAITTTDNGHPFMKCGGARHAGNFQLSSCLGRPNDFVFDMQDEFANACESVCTLTDDDLEITPTTTHTDPEAKGRRWLERIDGITNLPDGVSTDDAFQCFGPQGINGCGFEQHLESMKLSLIRTASEEEDEWGFIRPGALLAVIFVTDEADCSMSPSVAFSEAWTDPNSPFWSEEAVADNGPKSDVCWFAGVRCEGGPGTYVDCVSADIGADRGPAEPEDAVLRPLQGYVDFLQDIEDLKKTADESGNVKVLVSVIGGVPPGYAKGDSEITYADEPSRTQFQIDHGIGPGCSTDAGQAAPPVRMKEFADQFRSPGQILDGKRNLHSVCRDDYSEALRSIADEIGKNLKLPCVEACIADTDPVEPGLQPLCTVEQRFINSAGDAEDVKVQQCEGPAWDQLPAGADICWRALSGDARAPECVIDGANMQLDLVEREGVAPPPGASAIVTCSLAPNPKLECPDLEVTE